MPKNIHKDHVASCLCCKSFILDMGDGGYSDMTPGYDAYIRCSSRKFEFGVNDIFDPHEVFAMGETCKKFNGRD